MNPLRVSIFLIICNLFTLTGCANTGMIKLSANAERPASKDARYQPSSVDKSILAEHGVVIVSAETTTDVRGAYNVTFVLTRMSDEESMAMGTGEPGGGNLPGTFNNLGPNGSKGRIHVFQLTPGQYRIRRGKVIVQTGELFKPKDLNKPQSPEHAFFEVEKHAVNYIGNLYMEVTTGPDVFGFEHANGGVTTIRDQYDRDTAIAIELVPFLNETRIEKNLTLFE